MAQLKGPIYPGSMYILVASALLLSSFFSIKQMAFKAQGPHVPVARRLWLAPSVCQPTRWRCCQPLLLFIVSCSPPESLSILRFAPSAFRSRHLSEVQNLHGHEWRWSYHVEEPSAHRARLLEPDPLHQPALLQNCHRMHVRTMPRINQSVCLSPLP